MEEQQGLSAHTHHRCWLHNCRTALLHFFKRFFLLMESAEEKMKSSAFQTKAFQNARLSFSLKRSETKSHSFPHKFFLSASNKAKCPELHLITFSFLSPLAYNISIKETDTKQTQILIFYLFPIPFLH